MNYYQCKLRKGTAYQQAWIPEKYSRLKAIVKIKEDGIWDDGWEVVDVGTLAMDEESAVIRSRDYTKQRDASDV